MDHRFADGGVKLFGNSTGVVFETVEGHLSILADLDEVAVGITHVATPFPAMIVAPGRLVPIGHAKYWNGGCSVQYQAGTFAKTKTTKLLGHV